MIGATPATEPSALPWRRVQLQLGVDSYPYWYGYDCERELVEQLVSLEADRFLLVTDDRVRKLHGTRLARLLGEHAPVSVMSGLPGEQLKSLAMLSEHLEHAVADGTTRRSVVVALGGGTVGNLGGLMSALLYRGIRLVHIPTTTIAATDSVISLKQAVNSTQGKNHFGVYHRPTAVLADLKHLETLPVADVRAGVCEAIKNCLAIRPERLAELQERTARGRTPPTAAVAWLLEASIAAKQAVMRADAREQGAALVLEYGHTIGHALELCDHRARGTEALSHGEAIGVGMLAAARISLARGWLTSHEATVHETALSTVGATTRVPAHVRVDDVATLVARDNKRGLIPTLRDEVPFVLLRGLGRPARTGSVPLVPVHMTELTDALRYLHDGHPCGS